MKPFLLISATLWLIWPARSEVVESQLVVHYHLASDGTIDVRGGSLHWQKFLSALRPAKERQTKLNATNQVWLHRWIETHQVLTMREDFPVPAKSDAPFGSLVIRLGEQRRTISWEPGCDCPDLMAAIDDLKAFAAAITKDATTKSSKEDSAEALPDILKPAKRILFRDVVQSTTHHRLIDFDLRNEAHVKMRDLIRDAAASAGKQALAQGVFAARANEAGNHIEPFVKRALRELKLDARTPVNASGDAQITGYPDLEITGPVPCYLELKTYNAATANTTQRTFYYSPSSHPKITHDALHLLLAFEMTKVERGGRPAFVPTHWKLITLQDLSVDLKFEFNQSNRGLYGADAASAMLAEGAVND